MSSYRDDQDNKLFSNYLVYKSDPVIADWVWSEARRQYEAEIENILGPNPDGDEPAPVIGDFFDNAIDLIGSDYYIDWYIDHPSTQLNIEGEDQ
jgi:hypothetical protein